MGHREHTMDRRQKHTPALFLYLSFINRYAQSRPMSNGGREGDGERDGDSRGVESHMGVHLNLRQGKKVRVLIEREREK